MRFLFPLLALVCCVVARGEVVASGSFTIAPLWDGGPSGSGTFSLEYQEVGGEKQGKLSWTYNGSGVSGSLRVESRPTGTSPTTSGATGAPVGRGEYANDNLSSAGNSGWFTLEPDTAFLDLRSSGNWFGDLGPSETWRNYSVGAAPPPPEYYVTFNIPAMPERSGVARYIFRQGDNVVGEHTATQGEAATQVTIGPLATNDPVTMEKLEGYFLQLKNSEGEFVPGPFITTAVSLVSEGTPGETPPIVEVPDSTPVPTDHPKLIVEEPLPPIDPASVLVPTTGPTAQTPQSSVSAPGAPTLVSPSGTGAVTKEDSEANTNRLVTAVAESSTKATEVGNALISAVNKALAAQNEGDTKIIEAVDKVAGKVVETGNKNLEQGKRIEDAVKKSGLDVLAQAIEANKKADAQLKELKEAKEATKGVKTSVDSLGGKLDTLKGSVDAVKSAVESVNASADEEREAANQAKQTALDGLAATTATQRTAIEGSVDARAVRALGTDTDTPSGGGSGWVVEWPGVASFNLDPMSEPVVGSLAAWIKGAIAWLIFALFEWWLWGQFKEIHSTLVLVNPAKGNNAPAGVGTPSALLVAMGITAVMVSVPSAFWVLADSGLAFPSLVSHPVATAETASEKSVYLLKLFIPTGTLLSVLAQMFIVRKGGILLLGGVATAIRFVVP